MVLKVRSEMRARKMIFRPGFQPFSSFLAMRSTSRCAVSSSCLTVLASPDSAGGGFGRARAEFRRESAVFAFFAGIRCVFDLPPHYHCKTRVNADSTTGGIRRVACDMCWLLTPKSVVTPSELPRCVLAPQTRKT